MNAPVPWHFRRQPPQQQRKSNRYGATAANFPKVQVRDRPQALPREAIAQGEGRHRPFRQNSSQSRNSGMTLLD